jgi:hypothetical protein
MYLVSTTKTKASVRLSPNGESQVRLGAWINSELVEEFRKVCQAEGMDMSDVFRSAIQSTIAFSKVDAATSKGSAERKLASRMFRVLIGTMGAKEVLEDCLRLIPGHLVDKIIAKHRGESK